jgi:hypothetical protein
LRWRVKPGGSPGCGGTDPSAFAGLEMSYATRQVLDEYDDDFQQKTAPTPRSSK